MDFDFGHIMPVFQYLLGGSNCVIRRSRKLAASNQGSGATLVGSAIQLVHFEKGEIPKAWSCRRPGLAVRPTEVRLCDETMKGLSALYSRVNDRHYHAHFRTAFLHAAFDIGVARLLRGADNVRFAAIQRILETFKDLTFERYEGEPATSGQSSYRTLAVSWRVLLPLGLRYRHSMAP